MTLKTRSYPRKITYLTAAFVSLVVLSWILFR